MEVSDCLKMRNGILLIEQLQYLNFRQYILDADALCGPIQQTNAGSWERVGPIQQDMQK